MAFFLPCILQKLPAAKRISMFFGKVLRKVTKAQICIRKYGRNKINETLK